MDNGILFGIYLFALSSLISKAGTSIGIGIACLLWLIRIFITTDYNFTTTKLDRPILFFLSGLLISGLDVFSIKFLDSVEKIILVILFYYVIVNTIEKLKNIKYIIYIMTISMIISLSNGIYQIVYTNLDRIKGFSFPLAYGGFLAILLIYTTAYLVFGNNKWYLKLFLLSISIVEMINLLFTKSRGAWFAFLGGGLSLFWLKDKKWLIGFLLLIILLGIVLPPEFIDRFKSSFELEDNRSNEARIKQWKASLLMYKDHFINGVGIGYFTEEFRENYNYLKPDNRKHAHNNFLHFLATTGTVGFIAFCYLIWSIVKFLYNHHLQLRGDWGLFLLASLAAVIAFNIQGLTEFNFGDTETLRFFWFIVALNVVIVNNLIEKGGKLDED